MMWQDVSNTASVAQLVGIDALGLISKIRLAAQTVRQNKSDCDHLARRVDMLAGLLTRLVGAGPVEPVAAQTVAGLDETLIEAHHLVVSCQGHGLAYQLLTARRKSERFKNVNGKIDSYLQGFQIINSIGIHGIARHLGMMDTNGGSAPSHAAKAESAAEGADRFTLAELMVLTNNFAIVLGVGDSGTVYKGRLHDGPEVAVKRLKPGRYGAEVAFDTELAILWPLRHDDHIVHLLGFCAEDGERIIVTQLMSNGSLYDHVHGYHRQPSPVTSSWKARVQVLLGVARGVEHLHRRTITPIIHGGVTSSHVLLDDTWSPRLTGFGASVWCADRMDSQPITGSAAHGYTDPEFLSTGCIKPASDVYGIGAVMLEVLTGKPPPVTVWNEKNRSTMLMTMVSSALPSVQAGRLVDVLDRRPAAALTAWQMEPLQMVACTAARCLCLHGDNRPCISDVVADLEQALQLICIRGNF